MGRYDQKSEFADEATVGKLAWNGSQASGKGSTQVELFQHQYNIIKKVHEYFQGSRCSSATARVVEHTKMPQHQIELFSIVWQSHVEKTVIYK